MVVMTTDVFLFPTPGLMIWTIICFAITYVVLKRYAFGPMQRTIDERHDHIRRAVGEADHARNEIRLLVEQHRAVIGQAKSEAAATLADARRLAIAEIERMKEEAESERLRQLEETRRELEAETRFSLNLIRAEIADLTLQATTRVTGKALDADGRRLIEEALAELDFSGLGGESI